MHFIEHPLQVRPVMAWEKLGLAGTIQLVELLLQLSPFGLELAEALLELSRTGRRLHHGLGTKGTDVGNEVRDLVIWHATAE
jgi:hypothetical protein